MFYFFFDGLLCYCTRTNAHKHLMKTWENELSQDTEGNRRISTLASAAGCLLSHPACVFCFLPWLDWRLFFYGSPTVTHSASRLPNKLLFLIFFHAASSLFLTEAFSRCVKWFIRYSISCCSSLVNRSRSVLIDGLDYIRQQLIFLQQTKIFRPEKMKKWKKMKKMKKMKK